MFLTISTTSYFNTLPACIQTSHHLTIDHKHIQHDIHARSHGHYAVYDLLVSRSTSPPGTLSILLVPFDRNQPPVFPCIALRSMINHPHSSCSSDFYSPSAQPYIARTAHDRPIFFEHSTCILSPKGSAPTVHSFPPWSVEGRRVTSKGEWQMSISGFLFFNGIYYSFYLRSLLHHRMPQPLYLYGL